jgi:iron(III) transport system permease protein
MVAVLLTLGAYLLAPIVMLLVMSFNVAPNVLTDRFVFGFANWTDAWREPRLLASLGNSFVVWAASTGISLPLATGIAWLLARTNIPWSRGLEYLFWVAFMFPSLSSTLGWMMLLDPEVGYVNRLLQALPLVEHAPFNIFSLPGIVWARLMADGIAYKVMLLTPAFRNMDRTLEEAARVSGASDLRTMLRITLPVMASPILLVFALQVVRMFQGFETEQLLGAPWGFYVYSTLIFRLVNGAGTPMYAQAVVLATVTFALIALIFPLQRWIIGRRHYMTVTASYRPGVVDLRRWRRVSAAAIGLLLVILTVVPALTLVVGSFMVRSGFFNTTPLWTLEHWRVVLGDPVLLRALGTTLGLAFTSGILSPLLFSLVAYLIVRTRLRGRSTLDAIIWIAAGIPGILSGLGLLLTFLSVPGLSFLYGSSAALVLVLVVSGNTTGTNVFKGVLLQLGKELEESARVAGAGWVRTYLTVVLPVLAPTMVLIGILNFASAAGATSNIILLASRETMTLSLLTLEYAAPEVGRREAAGIVTLIIMVITLAAALLARLVARRAGLPQHAGPVERGTSRAMEDLPAVKRAVPAAARAVYQNREA